MNALNVLFRRARRSDEKLLSIFLTVGYPELDSALELVPAAASAGVDFIELGLPFSDPIADGPVIQAASSLALANGMTPRLLLRQVRELRRACDIPVLIMSYLNPILAYGLSHFVRDAEDAGVAGFIVPDLLPESLSHLAKETASGSIGFNFLAAPNTRSERLEQIGAQTHDFLYCVSTTGVTGSRKGAGHPPEAQSLQRVLSATGSGKGAGLRIDKFLKRARQSVSKPLVVGFGISSPEDAAKISKVCDGLIVGSEVLLRLRPEFSAAERSANFVSFVTELRNAVKGA